MNRPRAVIAALAMAWLGACGGNGEDDTAPPDAQPGTLDWWVDAYENGQITRDEFRAALADWPDPGIPALLPAEIGETTLLKPRGEPFRIDANLRVAEGAILVVEGGVELLVADAAGIQVDGRIYAVGSETAPVILHAAEGQRYGALHLASGPNQLVSVELERGNRLVADEHPFGIRTLVEGCRFDDWGDVAIDQVASSGMHVLRSRFGYQTVTESTSAETIRSRNSGVIVIEESEFNARTGYRDVIDLQDCVVGEWPIILRNRFDGGEDDGVDLDTCSALVIGNYLHDFRPQDLNNPFAGVNGGGVTGDRATHAVIIGNVIDGCYHGIGFKNGATPIILNNTIINSNIGITLYQATTADPMPHGIVINNVLANNLSWFDSQPQEIVLDGKWWPTYNQVDDVQATIDARYNITATLPAPYTGEGNLNDDPLLVMTDGVPVPGAGSPAIDSGLDTLQFDDVPMAQVLDLLDSDFLGNPRPRVGDSFPGIDRGAVEVQ